MNPPRESGSRYSCPCRCHRVPQTECTSCGYAGGAVRPNECPHPSYHVGVLSPQAPNGRAFDTQLTLFLRRLRALQMKMMCRNARQVMEGKEGSRSNVITDSPGLYSPSMVRASSTSASLGIDTTSPGSGAHASAFNKSDVGDAVKLLDGVIAALVRLTGLACTNARDRNICERLLCVRKTLSDLRDVLGEYMRRGSFQQLRDEVRKTRANDRDFKKDVIRDTIFVQLTYIVGYTHGLLGYSKFPELLDLRKALFLDDLSDFRSADDVLPQNGDDAPVPTSTSKAQISGDDETKPNMKVKKEPEDSSDFDGFSDF